MDSARPGNPSEFLSFEEAAQKLAVSVVELKYWEKQHILEPLTTPEGTGYTEAQLIQFKKDNSTLFQTQSETSIQMNGRKPGRAANVAEDEKLRHVGTSSLLNPYQKFLRWIGGKYYSDDFVKDYMKSQVKESLSIPSLKRPSRKAATMAVFM